MSPSIIVRGISAIAVTMALAVVAFHLSRGNSLEFRHIAFAAVQVILSLALLSRMPVARWAAAVLWCFQAVVSLLFVLLGSGVVGAATIPSILLGITCSVCAVLLFTPPAGRYFDKKA